MRRQIDRDKEGGSETEPEGVRVREDLMKIFQAGTLTSFQAW